jgi:hypothetical protein
VVEAQHRVSTRKLVDTLEEQALLEELIEGGKPPPAGGPRLHYLLATPFRYPPLRHGSRFGARHDPGIWYGAERRRTAFAEVAYYRFVFLEGTAADLGTLTTPLTAFRARVRTERGIDLLAPPFEPFRATIASPVDYAESQALGRSMRAAAVEAFRYPAARDPEGGVGVGVFEPRAFRSPRPHGFETWVCTATRERVELVEQDYLRVSTFTFERQAFLVGGTLPAPAP